MHKSTSFFERVDASMDSSSNTVNGNAIKTKPAKVKQTTLFGLTKPKITAPTAVSVSPAFAADEDSQEPSSDDEESIQLTLRAAANKEQKSIQLEETQYNNDLDSQYDSLPIDVAV